MSLPSCREIRNQLFILVGAATAVLATTTVILDGHKSFLNSEPNVAVTETVNIENDEFASTNSYNQVNWEDVNLSGRVNSPEDDIKTARGKILGDFEAR
ncbi:hypothetical protein BH10BDE1_BH10BDE1_18090 [soil metagenome]